MLKARVPGVSKNELDKFVQEWATCGDFCFVWSGAESELERLLERVGATIIEGPAPRQGGRSLGVDFGTSWYIRDPDGNLLEFIIYQ